MRQTELLDEPITTDSEIQGIPKRRRWPRWLLIIVAVAFITIFAWPPGVVFYTDWLWFKDLGYQTVFSTMLVTKVTLGLTVGLLAAAFTWLNFGLALRPSHEPADVQEGAGPCPVSRAVSAPRRAGDRRIRRLARLGRMGHLVALSLSVAVRRGRSDLRA